MDGIRIENVSKAFVLRHNRSLSLKSRFVGLFHRRYRETTEQLLAVDNVSFSVAAGSCMGIVGLNGSGKSTLLKIVAGILAPSSGYVKMAVTARVGTLIQLGVGFCPELTGIENIYLNGSLYGFGRTEIAEVYDDILAFAELERFIDTPLKNYSSGMYARLGFSIMAHLPMDIMLIDEVLSVGDQAFSRKCLARMAEFKQRGRTILFVSHAPGAVKDFCDQAVLLHEGKMLGQAEPGMLLDVYGRMAEREISPASAAAELAGASANPAAAL